MSWYKGTSHPQLQPWMNYKSGFVLQEYILSQDSAGSMTPDQWADFVFEQSRLIEPKDLPIKKAISCPPPHTHTHTLLLHPLIEGVTLSSGVFPILLSGLKVQIRPEASARAQQASKCLEYSFSYSEAPTASPNLHITPR